MRETSVAVLTREEAGAWKVFALLRRACAVALGAMILSGCTAEPAASAQNEPPKVVKSGAVGTAPTGGRQVDGRGRKRPVIRKASAPGPGALKLVYSKKLKEKHRAEIAEAFRDERFFEDIIDELNRSLVLSRNIEVRLEECGEPNAFYDPESKSVSMCYELFEYFMDVFTEQQKTSGETDEEVATKAVAALAFTFYHELGHALVDVYDLPITGREEDAVDQLATVMVLETWDEEDSELAILSSAEWFGIDAEETSSDPYMAGEHSLDEQRYYNLVCWIYGSDPEYFSDIATDWELPKDRAQRCESEYARMSMAWNTLLGPHMRPTPESVQ